MHGESPGSLKREAAGATPRRSVTRHEFADLVRAADCVTLHLRTARGLSPGRRAELAARLRHLLACLDAAEGRGIGAGERGAAARVKGAAENFLRNSAPTDLDTQ